MDFEYDFLRHFFYYYRILCILRKIGFKMNYNIRCKKWSLLIRKSIKFILKHIIYAIKVFLII